MRPSSCSKPMMARSSSSRNGTSTLDHSKFACEKEFSNAFRNNETSYSLDSSFFLPERLQFVQKSCGRKEAQGAEKAENGSGRGKASTAGNGGKGREKQGRAGKTKGKGRQRDRRRPRRAKAPNAWRRVAARELATAGTVRGAGRTGWCCARKGWARRSPPRPRPPPWAACPTPQVRSGSGRRKPDRRFSPAAPRPEAAAAAPSRAAPRRPRAVRPT